MKKTLLLILLILLVACSVPQVAITPEAKVTLRPALTATPDFLPTLSFTPTLNQTQVAIKQSTAATQSTFQTEVAKFPRLCPDDVPYFSDYSESFSPDGLWLGDLCLSEEYQDLVLTFSNKETRVSWNMIYHNYIPDVDYADGGMWIVHWSNDSRYAYFNSSLGGDGSECYVTGLDGGSALFRVDLQTGQTKAILPPSNSYWYGFSISPTDKRLVYSVNHYETDFLNLNILDITTGGSIVVVPEKNFSEAGGYIWSSDGLRFVYSTVKYFSNHEGRESYTVRLVDAQSGTERILIESPVDCFGVLSWAEDNILTIEKNYNESLIEFDLSTNTIVSEATIKP